MDMEKKTNHFSGQVGFVLAAAGSAVGVGNLWRFPYLAAKDGGGLFLLVYLALVLTFGFTLLTSDIAIGRRTKKSAIGAYTEMHPRWRFLGILTFLVPVLIMTYYAVIGGLNHEICSVLPDWSGRCRRPGQLFYQLYLLAGIACGVCPAVHGGHRLHRLQRRAGWH